jgi:glycosyltransferase involved in cell wall biosynthesis
VYSNTILYFGSLIRKKGLLELPLIFNEVIQKNPEAKLVLVGKDVPDIISGNVSTWQMMQKLFSVKAMANVTYLGSVDYNTIKTDIQMAGICVFPSFAEALPVSWLEAMAMKKGIVASNIGWGKEVVEDGKSGFLVHPKEHQLFADKINLLLENDDLAKQMGESARQRIEAIFDIDKIVDENIQFYKKTINL